MRKSDISGIRVTQQKGSVKMDQSSVNTFWSRSPRMPIKHVLLVYKPPLKYNHRLGIISFVLNEYEKFLIF